MTKEEVLEKLLAKLKSKFTLISFATLLKDLKIYSYKDSEVVLTIDENSGNDSIIPTVEKNFGPTIEEYINDITNDTCTVKFVKNTDLKKKESIEKTKKSIEDNYNESLNLEEDIKNYKYSSDFNVFYTFDNFEVGESNRLAYGTAMEVAKDPGNIVRNPYFLYSKSGLGKTHLMHAIGNYIVNNTDKKVLYVTTKQFMNDYSIVANSKGSNNNNISYLNAFRDKYKNIDVLMIDDIQALEKYTKTQMEFFDIFNDLLNSNKQIIMASDKSINDIKLLEDRLKTRFKSGLTVCINPPDIELKKKIIINKDKLYGFELDLSDEVLDYMANNCGSNGRALEGSLKRLVAYKGMFHVNKFSLEEAKLALVEYVDNIVYKTNSISNILDTVAKFYDLEVSMLKGKMKKKKIADARSVAMYLCKFMTDETYERIGLEIGGRDHSTVIHSCDKIERELKTNPVLQEEIKILKDKISE
jgi:chromosomal replication initiator protein